MTKVNERELDTLVEEAERIFGDDLAEPETPNDYAPEWSDAPVVAGEKEARWRPGRDKFIKVRGGGDYLGVRYRLLWMRSEHPDWTTRAFPHHIDWENGIAIMVGQVLDAQGRLIAEDMKTETRKDFFDFVEKACTGALGRALAGAGYGTEGALELDEGESARTGDLRIADAPVPANPVNITPSNVPGIKQGGRSGVITTAQIQSIARRSKELELGPAGVARYIDDQDLWHRVETLTDPAAQQKLLLDYLKGLTFDQAAKLLQKLDKAA